MLTVTHGRKSTRAHVLAYAVLLAPVAIWAAATSIGGPFTMAVSLALSVWFIKGGHDIWRRDEAQAEADKYATEKAFFRFSLLYLFVIFAAYLIEAGLKLYGLGGW